MAFHLKQLNTRRLFQRGQVTNHVVYLQPTYRISKTWLHLLTQNEDTELKEHGKDKLLSAFENMQAVANYIKNNHIKIG